MKQNKSGLHSYIGMANLILYTLIVVLMIIYFLVYGNNSLAFYISASIILIFLLLLHPKYLKLALFAALVLVAAGSAIYILLALPSLHVQEIGNNSNALGYVLVADCIVVLAACAIAENYSIGMEAKEIRKFFSANSAKMSYLLFAAALIILFGPFWPTGVAYRQNVNYTLSYYGTINRSYNLSLEIIPGSYALTSLCSSGTDTRFNITFVSMNPAVEFYMSNYSGLAEMPHAQFQQYLNYIKANAQDITSLGAMGAINFSVPGSCAELGVLTQLNNSVSFQVAEQFYGTVHGTGQAPAPGAQVIINKTGSLFSSVAYLKKYIDTT